MTTREVVSNGASPARLAVTEWGAPERPTVILVHGYPDTSAVWEPVAAQLAGRYHVVAYDVRGAGASSAPATTAGYQLAHLVEDLAAVADATSPGRPFHLVGHDWGSIQGWEAVSGTRLAGRVASFTSLFAPGLDHAAAWAAQRLRHPSPRNLGQLLGQQARSWYVAAFQLPGAARVWHGGLGRRWPQIQQKMEKVAPSATYPAPTLTVDGAQGIGLYRANFWSRMSRPHPRPTDVPVHVIVATKDHFVSPAMSEGLEHWVARLWQSEVEAGHWLPRTHPELVARFVADFVDHIEGGPETPGLRRARRNDAGAPRARLPAWPDWPRHRPD